MSNHVHVRVGVAVLIRRKDGTILVGKRKGSLGTGTWTVPGGHLEMGESAVACARREVLEETGLVLRDDLESFTITEDIYTSQDDKGQPLLDKHYITLWLTASINDADEAVNKEPEKCEGWEWHPMFQVPTPHFLGFSNLLTKCVQQNLIKHPIVVNPPVTSDLKVGDYVFASRWSDVSPKDPWYVGFVSEVHEQHIFIEGCRRSWGRAMKITQEQGQSILKRYPDLEAHSSSVDYLDIAKVFGVIG